MSAFIDSCDPEAVWDELFPLEATKRWILESNPGMYNSWWQRKLPFGSPPVFLKSQPLPDTTIRPLFLLHKSMYRHGLPPTYPIKLDPLPWRKD